MANMLKTLKKVGETPLELISRIRLESPELATERLSYAGRLDPMAEGEMLIIVGNENDERDKFMGFDKEYEAEFLFGVSTDSGDVLGLITGESEAEISQSSIAEISAVVQNFTNIKSQKYPWFSSKTVFGIKLFEHFKRGNLDIERPTRDVEIKSVEILNFEEKNTEEIKNYIFDSINKVNGDFRQKETIESWREFFAKNSRPTLHTLKIKILVSSGTYIRALTENFPIPTTLLKLNRTKIISEL
ncbi:MAG: tRNA pseudouridine synthase tRNA pseudouridine55 synthase [Bacteroidota bacterium]